MTNAIKKIDSESDPKNSNIQNNPEDSSQNSSGEKIETVEIENYEEEPDKQKETNLSPSISTGLLHDKLIGDIDKLSLEKGVGVLGMAAYGTTKGVIEETPQGARLAMNMLATESIVERNVTSKLAGKTINASFNATNAALFPPQWMNYSDEVFTEVESSIPKVGRLTGDNFNVLRSGGARLNFAINAVFAGYDGYRVGEYYESHDQHAIEHAGEITGRVTGETVGGAGGFALGMAIGVAGSTAITGAVCGSVVPGVGTAVGFFTGAIVGAVGAVVLGDVGATAGSYIDGNNGEIVYL